VTDTLCLAQPLMSCRDIPLRRDSSDWDRPHSLMTSARFAAARRMSPFTERAKGALGPLAI
jgi:hypothetical protein